MNINERITCKRSWLTRNLFVLCIVSFLQDAASELLYPILPIYLTVTLGAPVFVVGLVEGLAEAIAAITKLWSGRLSDRWRRKPLIGLGYSLAAVGKMLIASVAAWPMVLAGRGVDRVGKGIRGAPRDALLGIGVASENRGKVFGLHRAMDSAGAVVGPLLGLGLYKLFDGNLRPLLFVAIVPAIASACAVYFIVDIQPTTKMSNSSKTLHTRFSGSYRRLVAVLAIFAVVNIPDSLLLLRARAIGLSVPQLILAYVLFNAVNSLLSYPLGALSDRLRPKWIMAGGLMLFAFCYIGLGITSSTTIVWVLLIAYGGFAAATDGVGKAWVSRLAPKSEQGRAQGTYQSISGFGVLAAGLWAGLSWNGSGRFPLIVAGCVAASVAIALSVTNFESTTVIEG